VGTAVVNRSEIAREIEQESWRHGASPDPGSGKPAGKILTPDQVDAWVRAERAAGRRIGFTCGTFDLLHAGHAQYLAEARSLCDRLLVAVNSDESVQRYKSPLRPVNPWKERALVVAAMSSCDCVTVLDEDRPLSLLLRWKPDLYIKGGDYKSASSLQSASAVEAYGGRVAVIPAEFDASTTAILERVQALAVHALPEPSPPAEMRGLVLLDRDGTLVRDSAFDPSEVELLPGAIDALHCLQSAGYRLCVVSNQQGIGLGLYGYRDFVDSNRKLLRKLGEAGIAIARIYFCPHSLADRCECRKPAPGMILRAMRDYNVPAERCFVIGDSPQDLEAARAAGCRGFYTGPPRASEAACTSLAITEAARRIVEWGAAQLRSR
jgi:rfaE bifunctional protein nucleotidyltransferase chain/domain